MLTIFIILLCVLLLVCLGLWPILLEKICDEKTNTHYRAWQRHWNKYSYKSMFFTAFKWVFAALIVCAIVGVYSQDLELFIFLIAIVLAISIGGVIKYLHYVNTRKIRYQK